MESFSSVNLGCSRCGSSGPYPVVSGVIEISQIISTIPPLNVSCVFVEMHWGLCHDENLARGCVHDKKV